MNSQFQAVLPLSSSIGEFWPSSQKFVALPQGCQITLTSRFRAVYLAFRLLQSLIVNGEANQASKYNTPTFSLESHLPWALDICRSLWQRIKHYKHAERDRLLDAVEAMYMEVLETAALPSIALGGDSPYSLKAGVALSTSLAELIQSCTTCPFSVPNQVRLASTLTRLRGALENADGCRRDQCRSRRSLENLITDNITPAIIDICQKVAKFTTLQKDLQVSIIRNL